MGGIQLKEAGTFWSCSSLWPRVRHGQDPLAIVLHLKLGGRTLPSTPMARDNPGAPHPTWPHHIRTPSSNASLIAHEAHLKILVLKGVAIDGFSASTISLGDVLTTRCCTPTLKWGISCCLQVPTGRPVSDPHVVSPTPPPKKMFIGLKSYEYSHVMHSQASPPMATNPGMTQWNTAPRYVRRFPLWPRPGQLKNQRKTSWSEAKCFQWNISMCPNLASVYIYIYILSLSLSLCLLVACM